MILVNSETESEIHYHWHYRSSSLPASYMVILECLQAEAVNTYLYICRGDEKSPS